MTYEKSGVIVINKPQQMTSHDVVAIVRRTLKTKKVGHTGTLDPMATGVLPVCLGKATKIVDFLTDRKKAYRCEMRLGSATDTQDVWGRVTDEGDTTALTEALIRTAVESFIGEIDQIPPMFSALKVGGRKLVDLAREGIEIEREPRKRFIYAIENLSIDGECLSFTVTCSKGTYVRTLCHDIGLKLGCYGHMTSLERILSEPFTLDMAVDVEQLSPELVAERLIPIETALDWMPKIILPTQVQLMKDVSNGVSTDFSAYCDNLQQAEFYRIYFGETFYGIAERREQGIFMKKLMIG